MVFSLMAVFAGPAEGQGNPPSVECASTDPLWNGEYWKIQVGDNGQPTGSPETSENVVNGDITLSIENLVVTWTNNSDYYVFRVVEKGGQYDEVNEGMWGPGEGDTFGVEQSISHITFCFTDEVPPEPGQIIVEKEVTAGSDTSVAFTFNTTGFTLDDNTLAHGESGSSGDLDAGNYAVSETVPAGWSLQSATCDNGDDPSSIDLEAGETVTCTFVNDELPEEPEPGEIIVQKAVLDGSQTFQFTFNTTGFTLADNTLAHGQSSSSGEVAPGDGYAVSETLPPGWTMVSAVCDDGSPVTNIDVEAGETVTCTFTNIADEVQASILVQVTGTCIETDGEGEGRITVSMSVAGGADVVIRNSSGAVVGTLSADGSITVPEGATYTWEATPNEGFEFPEDADTSGSITIATCSDPETLPFTGIDLDLMAAYAAALLAGGLAMLLYSRRAEES
jgi:hypothetical protein